MQDNSMGSYDTLGTLRGEMRGESKKFLNDVEQRIR